MQDKKEMSGNIGKRSKLRKCCGEDGVVIEEKETDVVFFFKIQCPVCKSIGTWSMVKK